MDLVSYIRGELQKGKSAAAIRQFAVSRGYNPAEVDRAIRSASTKTVRHEIHFSKTTVLVLILVVAGLAVIGGVVYFFNPFSNQQESLLDLQVTALTKNVVLGSPLRFTVDLSNLGSRERFDVVLRHVVTGAGGEVAFNEESIAIETRSSKEGSVIIPVGTDPGSYTLRTTARYDGKVATAAFSFTVSGGVVTEEQEDDGDDGETVPLEGEVLPEEQSIEEVQSCPICNDRDACTRDVCARETNFQCRYEPITPCCGNSICEPSESFESCGIDCAAPIEVDDLELLEPWEKVEAVKQLTGNPEEAGALCTSIEESFYADQCFFVLGTATAFLGNCDFIEDERVRDECYIEVALGIQDNSICDQLEKATRRDACYIEFFKELLDYSVCDRIVNDYMRQSCQALSVVS